MSASPPPDLFWRIPEFGVTRLPDGTWRARHLLAHDLVIERATWQELEAACSEARHVRSRRIAGPGEPGS